jgi:hypothetical protein
VKFYVRNEDLLVRLNNGVTVVLKVKGFEDQQTKKKHPAANRRVEAVNNWGQLRRRGYLGTHRLGRIVDQPCTSAYPAMPSGR